MHVFLAVALALAPLGAVADCNSVKATLGHTSCNALQATCKNEGGLSWAHTTSVDGGEFKCKNCPKMNVQGGGDGVDVGKGFKILQGIGLHYTLACVGVIALLYALAMCMEKHDADDAASRGTASGDELGFCGRVCRWVRLFCLRRTGYVMENGTPFSYVGMIRETQPWELMYCYTCGTRFNCAKDSVKKSWLRWAHFYYSLCLSLGLSVMFSAIVLSEQAKACHYDTADDDETWYSKLPLEHFTETYVVVMVLCKMSDTSVAYLTSAATHRTWCASQLVRWLLIAVGALFVAGALYFQYDVQKLDDVTLEVGTKIWAYTKMVLITRGTIWLVVTPITTLLCYLTGRCLYRPPADEDVEVGGFSLTGMHADESHSPYSRVVTPPGSEDGSAIDRPARTTLAPSDWAAQQQGGPVMGTIAGAGGAPSAPAWGDRPVSLTRA